MVKKGVSAIIDRTIRHLVDSLSRGQAVEFRNFGVFQVKRRKARVGRNPQHPQFEIPIPARTVVKFNPGKDMKDRVRALTRVSENSSSLAKSGALNRK